MFMTIIIFLAVVALAFAAGWNINGYFGLEREIEKIDRELEEESRMRPEDRDCELHVMRDKNGEMLGIGYYVVKK